MLAAVLYARRDIRLENRPRPQWQSGMVLLRVRRAGICGSDLHYFEHGRCAAFVPTRPFVPGHELTGEVVAAADDVPTLKPGMRVTVNPTRPCGFCDYCKVGRINLCRRITMLGSASTVPPTDGAFAEFIAVHADQCHALPPEISDGAGALMEPFAVAWHAVKRAGCVGGKKILVLGGGPIGLLVALTARAFGAAPVALSEPAAARRQVALKLGAEAALDPTTPDWPARTRQMAGDGFDFIFEASGSPSAFRLAFDFVRPGGTVVQIGTLGTADVPLPANLVMNREIQFIGSFRYGHVFDEAIQMVASGRVNLQPLVSDVFPLEKIADALCRAADQSRAIKVQIEIP
ncbi:MAG TPA: L-idonate 5-dehydrogenase [Verrucomicrobiae bacterium]|nr:L-idonate 5-dehydrogenase [Verrucomicrobiae bacterium]